MKITFFKSEDQIAPHYAYAVDNAEQPKVMEHKLLHRIYCFTTFGCIIAFFIFVNISVRNGTLLREDLFYALPGFLIAAIVILPLHELCHALAAALMRKPIDGIRFFPNGLSNGTKPDAYVKLKLCAMNRAQFLFFALSPLIFITAVALLLCFILLSWFRFTMAELVLLNLFCAHFDVVDTVRALSMPHDAYFIGSCWVRASSAQPILVHIFSVSDDPTRVIRQDYSFDGKQLNEELSLPDARLDAIADDFRTRLG